MGTPGSFFELSIPGIMPGVGPEITNIPHEMFVNHRLKFKSCSQEMSLNCADIFRQLCLGRINQSSEIRVFPSCGLRVSVLNVQRRILEFSSISLIVLGIQRCLIGVSLWSILA